MSFLTRTFAACFITGLSIGVLTGAVSTLRRLNPQPLHLPAHQGLDIGAAHDVLVDELADVFARAEEPYDPFDGAFPATVRACIEYVVQFIRTATD